MQKAGLVAALGLMLHASHAWAADGAEQPRCPTSGSISASLVPTKIVAAKIYRAVALGIDPRVFEKYPFVTVVDEGDRWSVSQTGDAPPPKPRPGYAIVSAGGGQLNMEIDKCTGAVTYAAFNK